MNIIRLASLSLSIVVLSGCVAPIGQEKFSCENPEDGKICAGPRDIYELTNNRDSLKDITQEELNAQKGIKKNTIIDESKNAATQYLSQNDNTVYKPRSILQNSPTAYQQAEVITKTQTADQNLTSFQNWPSNGEPLAPEPLAVVSMPKIMRVLIAAWKDSDGNLHMPGYNFIEVEPKTFSIGEAANLRPTRVVPLHIREKTQEEIKQQQHQKKGVNPLEVMLNGDK